MKNYNDLTNDLLERRDIYVENQKKKRKKVMSVVSSLCCFCLVALIGLGMRQGGMFSMTPPEHTIDDSLYPGVKDTFDDKNGEAVDNPVANNKIIIHSTDGISSNKMNIALMCDDFVEMTREDMIRYYGVDYIPNVPSDIKSVQETKSGIYKRNGGNGDVYWDADVLNYSNEDSTRMVSLEVDKGSYVFHDYCYFKGTEEKSVINNVELLIGKTDNGILYAEFLYKGVGFYLSAEGLTQDEFVSIISSIVE